jgi:hypothetical protein
MSACNGLTPLQPDGSAQRLLGSLQRLGPFVLRSRHFFELPALGREPRILHLLTRADVGEMQRGRLWGAFGLPRRPGLRRHDVAAGQEPALRLAADVPFGRTQEEPRARAASQVAA